jgi:hypothetical protein
MHGITRLYGFDIQFGWDPEWIEYVNHTKMIPVEQYPEGILHAPTIPVKNDVDETASMPGAEPGTMYWLAEAAMLPAEPFEGDGVCFRITFRIKKQPAVGEPDSIIILKITGCTAVADSGLLLLFRRDGEVVIHALQMRGPGDLNYDGKVDILDLQLGISAYGCRASEPGWIPEADEAPPYGVIDLIDLVTICSHYGNHYP